MKYRCEERGVNCHQHSMPVDTFVKEIISAGIPEQVIVRADEVYKDKVGCQTWKNVILEVNGLKKHYTNINSKTIGYAINWYKKNCYDLSQEMN